MQVPFLHIDKEIPALAMSAGICVLLLRGCNIGVKLCEETKELFEILRVDFLVAGDFSVDHSQIGDTGVDVAADSARKHHGILDVNDLVVVDVTVDDIAPA